MWRKGNAVGVFWWKETAGDKGAIEVVYTFIQSNIVGSIVLVYPEHV